MLIIVLLIHANLRADMKNLTKYFFEFICLIKSLNRTKHKTSPKTKSYFVKYPRVAYNYALWIHQIIACAIFLSNLAL